MGSEQNRFPQQERRKRWGGCFAALSCFGNQKGCKRIVPASRVPEGYPSSSNQNGHPTAGSSTTALAPSLLAPPSSPASFTQSPLPSTVQSPSCFLSLSANSPRCPTSTMYATGPYAHETQLVSPPVFSTFTTEPSTAPFTPPPELAHLTTPSSPDVPFAQFLTSSATLRNSGKNDCAAANDLQTYSLYPGSPATSLRSPQCGLSGECSPSSFPEMGWSSLYSASGNGALPKASRDTNFFCPATFAKFYLDHNPSVGGRISVSKDSDVYPGGGNAHHNRFNRSPKQDAEELEAYRASFGFSADEVTTTSQYVEITDVNDSLPMTPFPSTTPTTDAKAAATLANGGQPAAKKDHKSFTNSTDVSDDDDIFAKAALTKTLRKYEMGLSTSDAEIDYRRGRSIREGRGNLR